MRSALRAGLGWGVPRKTVATLMASAGLGGIGVSLSVTDLPLLAQQSTGSTSIAGLPETAQVLGTAVASLGLSMIMFRRGRRPGLALGYGVGACGAVLGVIAGREGAFILLLLGAWSVGFAAASTSQSRYAATDLAAPTQRARALSVTVAAAAVGAVCGPNLVGPSGRLARALALPSLTGPLMISAAAMLAAAVTVEVCLRPDPLLTASHRVQDMPAAVCWREVLGVLRHVPAVRTGVVALVLGHAVMISVMVMSPIQLRQGGATLNIIGLIISGHVAGMYLLAPAVGWACDLVGRRAVLAASCPVLLAALGLAGGAAPGSFMRPATGLFFLGLGWSMCTIAASTWLSESAPTGSRIAVQGIADLAMGLAAGAAGALSGVVVGQAGYSTLAAVAAVPSCGILAIAILGRTRHLP